MQVQLAAIIVISLVVIAVAIDAIARLDERRPRTRDEAVITTQKIIVDLTRRR